MDSNLKIIIKIYMLLKANSSLGSIFSRSEISFKVYKSGWEVLVHHLETVTGSLPNCSGAICQCDRFPLILLLFYLVFDVLFLSPLNNKLNLNANLIIFSLMTKGLCSIRYKIRQAG